MRRLGNHENATTFVLVFPSSVSVLADNDNDSLQKIRKYDARNDTRPNTRVSRSLIRASHRLRQNRAPPLSVRAGEPGARQQRGRAGAPLGALLQAQLGHLPERAGKGDDRRGAA